MDEYISVEKSELRSTMLKQRNKMKLEDVRITSEKIQNSILEEVEYREAKEVFVYLDFKNEVITDKIIRHAFANHKKVAVPKVLKKGTMEFYYIESLEQLSRSSLGILEPRNMEKIAYPTEAAYMVMPGVVFDENRNRIGFGGGYYDRYLRKYSGLNRVAIAYDYQVLTRIPHSQLDVKAVKVITEKRKII